MMLREIIADPWLSKYNALVLDEAHERTVVRRSLLSPR
jgi:HrpA-like RNA helicase